MLVAVMLLAMLSAETADHSAPLVRCPNAGRSGQWTVVKNHRKALAFVEEARKTVQLIEGTPFDCGLQLAAMCAPDLDGDGVPEIVVRVRWEERQPDGDDSDRSAAARCHARSFKGSVAPYSSVFLILSSKKSGSSVQVLSDETGSGREGGTQVHVTSWNGRPALKLHLTFMNSDSGETEETDRVVIVEGSKLSVVHEKPARSKR